MKHLTTASSKPKSLREILTEDISDEITRTVRDELANSQASLTHDDKAAIEREIVCQSALVLEALGTDELQSAGALALFLINIRCDTKRLMRDWSANKNRATD